MEERIIYKSHMDMHVHFQPNRSHIHTNFIDNKVSEAHLGLKSNYKLVWVNSNGE